MDKQLLNYVISDKLKVLRTLYCFHKMVIHFINYLVGTDFYRAPDKDSEDYESYDVWSAGIILYQMIFGY